MNNVNAQLAPLMAGVPNPPDMQAAFDMGWWEATLNAPYWWGMKDVLPYDAALLLCGLNPRSDGTDPTKAATGETTEADYIKLHDKFDDEKRAIPKPRTLAQWLLIAKASGLKHHPWIDQWVTATGQQVSLRCEGPVLTPSVEGHSPTTHHAVHKQKSRGDVLAAVIELAKQAAADPSDYQSVWASLVSLAEGKDHPAPLTGYAEGEERWPRSFGQFFRFLSGTLGGHAAVFIAGSIAK
jgi:hypothetical protein